MPEAYIADVAIKDVRIGEPIVDWAFDAHDERPVGNLLTKDVKTKFTYFTTSDGKKQYRFESSCVAKVNRERETEEEAETRKLQNLLMGIDHEETAAYDRLEDLQSKLGNKLADDESLYEDDFRRLIEAQHRVALWREITVRHRNATNRIAYEGPIVHTHADRKTPTGEVTEMFTRLDSIKMTCDNIRKQQLDKFRALRSGMSGDGLRQVIGEIEREVRLDFYDDFEGTFGRFSRYMTN